MEDQPNIPGELKKEISNWRYIITPILVYIVCIYIFSRLNRESGLGFSLIIGGAVGFGFTVMWIVQWSIWAKEPSRRRAISIKKLLWAGVGSLIFFIIWVIAISIIYI